MTVTNISGLVGAGDDLFTFGALTSGVLNFNTATALKNTVNPGMTSGADIGDTGLAANFAGAATNFVSLAGHVSINFSASVGLNFDGDVLFQVADQNGATAGGQVLTVGLTDATAVMSVTGVSATASGINATFTISNAGVVGSTTIAGLVVSGGGVSVSAFTAGTFNLDTTAATTAFTIGATVAVSINQGGIAANLSGTFTFDRSTLGGEDIIKLSVSGASTSFAAGTTVLSITGISGSFAIKNNGFAGKAAVTGITLTGLPGFTFNVSNLFFEINTTDTEITGLAIPGGSTLDFTGTDRKKFFRIQGDVILGLELGGIAVSLDGTFYFEQYSYDPDGAGVLPATNVVKFATANATASFTAGSVKVEVTGVTGGFLLNDAGIAGFVTATAIAVTGVDDVTADGSDLSFAINTTNAAVAATFDVVGADAISFDYSAADELNFVSVGGTINLGLAAGGATAAINGSIAFYGATITDPVSLITTEVVKIGGENLGASIVIGPVTATITDVDFIVVLMDAGVAGRITFGDLSIATVANFKLTATNFAFEFNTTGQEIDQVLAVGPVNQTLQYTAAADELDFFRGSGTASLEFKNGSFETTLTGTFGFEQLTLPDTTQVVKFGFSNVSFSVGLGDPMTGPKLNITGANGFFVFGKNSSNVTSYAGKLDVTSATLTGVTGLTLSVSGFSFEVNTYNEAVDATIVGGGAGGTDFELDYTDSTKFSFLALGGTVNLGINMGGFTSTLIGTFYFEKTTIGADTYMKASVTNAHFDLGVGGVSLAATAINGAFLIQGDGKSAGKLSIGQVAVTGVTGLTFTVDDFALQFNNTGGAISVNIPVPGDPAGVDLDFTDSEFHDFISVAGTLHLGLTVGSFSTTLSGSFLFEQSTGKMKIGIKDGAFDLTAGPVTLNITEVNGAFVLYEGVDDGNPLTDDGTLAMQLSIGKVELTGITGFTFEVTDFFLSLNNTGGAVHEALTFGDGSTAAIDFTTDITAVGGTVDLGIEFGGFATTLSGSFLFEQVAAVGADPAKIKIGIKDAAFKLELGTVALNITEVTGLFVLYEGVDDGDPLTDDGTLAMQLSIGQVELTGITGFTFEVTDFFLKLNNTGGAVNETFDFDGDPLTTADALEIDFDGDITALGGTVDLGIEFGGFATTLSGSFLFEQHADKVLIGIKDAAFKLKIGTVALNITEVTGLFALYDGTLAMQLSIGQVALTGITGFTFEVTDFFLKLNNTGGAVNETFDFDGDPLTTADALEIDFDAGHHRLGWHGGLGDRVRRLRDDAEWFIPL